MRWTHFPLHTDTPAAGRDLDELFRSRGYRFDLDAAHARLGRLMAAESLPFAPQRRTFNSRLAQELAAWAEDLHPEAPIHRSLFAAYFVDGKNISDVRTLVELAGASGLPVQEAAAVLDERRYKGRIDADWQRAAELGVTGVPTFFIAPYAVVGAQPYDALRTLAERAGVASRGR